jgi:lysophospholipase L1-like esterase
MRPARLFPVFAVLLLLPIAPVVASAFVPPASPLGAVGAEYLALGDSLATGVGSSRCPIGCAGNGGYVADFAKQLGERAGRVIQVKDLGVAGETSDSFIGDFFTNRTSKSQLARAVTEIRAHGSAINPVTLDIGGNDALKVRGTGPGVDTKQAALARFRANLEAIVASLQDALHAAGAGGKLILLAYYDPWGQADPDLWGIARLNQAIRDVGSEYGVRVAEPFTAFVGSEPQLTWVNCRCPIDVHPNDRGYTLLAGALAAVSYWPQAPAGSVAGTAYAPDGSPAAGAWVWYGDGLTQADAYGGFRFDGVGATSGLRVVAIDADGSLVGEADVDVSAGNIAGVEIDLEPPAGASPQTAVPGNDVSGYARIAQAIGHSMALQARQWTGRTATQLAKRAVADARRVGERLESLAGGSVHRLQP